MNLLTMFSVYLIYPVAGLLLSMLAVIIAKKQKLLQNKSLVVYFLLTILILAVFGLAGWLDYKFMPYGYLALTLVYLLLGFYNIQVMRWVMRGSEPKFRVYLLLTIFVQLIGMLLFALVFNLVSELKYGIWASTSMLLFILPLLFARTYRLFLGIPAEIFKIWHYSGDYRYADYDRGEAGTVIVPEIELFRTEGDDEPVKLKVKAPLDMPFGMWFFRLIEDHNVKSPATPIAFSDDKNMGWIFYVRRFVLMSRRYIDPDRTIKENKLGEKHSIIARRVRQSIKEE